MHNMKFQFLHVLSVLQVGGSFGALFGFALMQILPYSWDIQPGVYALLCATAVLGGVFRSTFSLVIIVVEGTKGGRLGCAHSCGSGLVLSVVCGGIWYSGWQ